MGGTAINALTTHEGIVRSRGDGVHVVGVAVVVIVAEVVHVDVANVGVVDIHVAPVAAAAMVPGAERFTPTQGEPAISAAKAKPEAEPAAEKTDVGRTIESPTPDRTGAPTPAPAKPVPAAIVVGSKTPRLVTDPGPAPRADPVPVAVAVRSPVGADIVRSPNRAVVGLFAPGAVVVQVAVTDSVA